jgi:hypothetical protein
MTPILRMFAVIMLLWSLPAAATLVFFDSFTRSGELVGTSPDIGGGAYVYAPTGFGSTDTKVGTGSSAYLAVQSQHSGAFVNFSIRTTPTGLNYAYSPTFYMAATFNSSDLSRLYGGHLGVEVGIDVYRMGGGSLVRQQQIGLGQNDWYGDSGDNPHTVAWGSGAQFGRHSLGGYTLGDTVTLALKFEEKLVAGQYSYEVFAGAVPLSGAEPAWTSIAVEGGKPEGYSVTYIGLNVGGINHGHPITHSGYIDDIRIGKTWADVAAIPEPETYALMLVGLGLTFLRWRRSKRIAPAATERAC